MININKLKGKIVECGLSISDLSYKINMNASTFYRKLNSDGDTFTIKETKSISKALSLNITEINDIFFNDLVA